MNAETAKAIREITGHSQRSMAEALGVSERAVRYWETGRRNIPADTVEWLEGQLADHDAMVDATLDGTFAIAEERGWHDLEEVVLSYWRSQEEMDEAGKDGEVGVINARTREIAQALRREGLRVAFHNEA